MKKLIINTDDFGISKAVNHAIIDAHRRGVMTSTTLLINGPEVLHAVDLLKQNPDLGIGLHLNLTMFKPLTAIPELCNKNGVLDKKQALYDGLIIDSALIYQE